MKRCKCGGAAEVVTRDEALAVLCCSLDPTKDLAPGGQIDALNVLSRPCIDIQGYEVVSDMDGLRGQALPSGVLDCDRVVVLRRRAG